MNLFLRNFSIFLIPIIVFLGCYEVILRDSNSPNIYAFKNELLDKEFTSIVIGNSHALRGVLAEELSHNTINLANVSQSIDIDVLWLQRALSKQNLNFVILNFSVPTFTMTLEKSPENWRLKNYNLYTGLRLNYSPKYNFEFLNGRQLKNFKKVGNYVLGNKVLQDNYLEKGSFPINDSRDHFEEHALKASKRHVVSVENIEQNSSWLNEIIEMSRTNDFDIIIVTPPAHESYRKLIPKEIKTKMFSLLSDIEFKNNNVYWLNYFNNINFDSSSFKDSDHLNVKGAKLFTAEINNFLKNRNTNTNQ